MYRRFGKRALDVVCSAAGIVLLSPLLLALAVWVKLDSPGPVLFRQKRVGKGENAVQHFEVPHYVCRYAEGRAHASAAGPGRHDHALRAVSAPHQPGRAAAAFLIFLPGR